MRSNPVPAWPAPIRSAVEPTTHIPRRNGDSSDRRTGGQHDFGHGQPTSPDARGEGRARRCGQTPAVVEHHDWTPSLDVPEPAHHAGVVEGSAVRRWPGGLVACAIAAVVFLWLFPASGVDTQPPVFYNVFGFRPAIQTESPWPSALLAVATAALILVVSAVVRRPR